MSRRLTYYLFILVLVFSDQLTKAIIAKNIPFLTNITVIPGFLNLTHIRNRGAIFGFFSSSGSQTIHILLLLASLTALFFVIFYFFKTPPSERFFKISLSLILAGAFGNLVDRILKGYVIDFLDFYVKKWHWPSFNLADSCITVGAFFLIVIFFFKRS